MHCETGLSPQDWVAARCPWLSGQQVADVVTVAWGITEPAHAPVREAVLPVRRAAAVLRALVRVKPFLDTDGYGGGYAGAVDQLLGVATQSRFTDRDLRKVTDHLACVVLPERDHDAKARAAAELRGGERVLVGGWVVDPVRADL